MNLVELQEGVNELLKGLEHPRVGAALALAEECGEVMKWVMEREMYGGAKAEDLSDELGDVLVALAELASRYGIRLEDAASGALAKLREKGPTWQAELGGRLEAVRRRMDG
jgi:uncharacterized protein YabN with tetrapyrrole methylase and pyrophosphatase domain